MTKKSNRGDSDNTPAREAILEALVNAALAGHDLAPFEPADTDTGAYQARCRRCG